MTTLGVPRGNTFLTDINSPTKAGNPREPTIQRPWQQFFNVIAKRLNTIQAVAAIASPSAAAAPAAYDQTHIQTIVTELNELKTQFNALVAAQNV